MNCKEAIILLGPYITGDLESKSYENFALEAHLRTCKACAVEYVEFKETIKFINDNKAEFTEAFKNVENKEAAANMRKIRIIRFVVKISVAACLFIGISL
ncbi:MAG: zf-HC2 domain-containing protein [Sedimentisphaerales bacterium]|nr:zf-HC2 domain-containing protein [Sedimentisphaerales bacterium]